MIEAMFLGGSSKSATLQAATYTDEIEYGVEEGAEVDITFQNDGRVAITTNSSGVIYPYRWLLSGDAGDFSVAATPAAGTFTSSSPGALSTSRMFSVAKNAPGSKTCTASFTISADGAAVATASITLTATVS